MVKKHLRKKLKFQSHAGSIEAAYARYTRPDGKSFNPTLVRLRLIRSTASWITRPGFQSHAGSIEAPDPAQRGGCSVQVSIPRWFD